MYSRYRERIAILLTKSRNISCYFNWENWLIKLTVSIVFILLCKIAYNLTCYEHFIYQRYTIRSLQRISVLRNYKYWGIVWMGASSPYSYSKCALKRFCTDVYKMGCRECERVYDKAFCTNRLSLLIIKKIWNPCFTSRAVARPIIFLGGCIFIYSCSARRISFESDSFYGMWTWIYEYTPSPPNYRVRLATALFTSGTKVLYWGKCPLYS